jgi:dTDP-glucose 4,6-dehydratase
VQNLKITSKTILVTGAAGFIGSFLTEKFAKMGACVKAFVKYNSRNDIGCLNFLPKKILDDIEIIMGDLRNADALKNTFKNTDIVIHLGAVISIPYSYIRPEEVVETNVLGTLNVLTSAKDANVERVVHASTSEVYGTARYIPIDEEHPLQAQSPYSASKIAADKLVESFYRTYNLPVVTIRPFNTYGPRQSTRAIIPAIIVQMLTKNNIQIGALKPVRDFTYIDDMINAFLKIVLKDGIEGETINIGSGVGVSVEHLVNLIKKIVRKDVKVVVNKKRLRPPFSEVERLIADTKKARAVLDWKPKVTLENGLKRTVRWFEKHIDIYKPEVYAI